MYEIIPRTKDCLPMPPTGTANALRLGILGRTQRDNKVDLCHFVDMNSHSHTLAVSTTEANLARFYMELNKKTTNAVKALTGCSSLSIWEDQTAVTKVLTLQDAINRVVYLYCNPSKACLAAKIDEYPGINSWQAFLECEPAIDAEVTIEAYWYPSAAIPMLPKDRKLSHAQDAARLMQLAQSKKRRKQTIVLKPFKWLEQFGVRCSRRIAQIRDQIIAEVREREACKAAELAKAGLKFFGAEALRREKFMKPHSPKKKGPKMAVVSSDSELRARELQKYRAVSRRCRECYVKAKAGIWVEWPKGTFMPWFPPGFVFPGAGLPPP